MNANKAREFFSSYSEGSLDNGLRQAFENALNTDAEIQAEYRAFERTMLELATLKDCEAEVPFDLNERISARLDRHIFEQKRAKPTGIAFLWKPFLVGGLAALAIVATVLSMNRTGGGAQEAGLGLSGGQKPRIEQPKTGFELRLDSITGETPRKVSMTKNGETLDLGAITTLELKNEGDKPEFVSISIEGEPSPLYVAVPAKQGSADPKDETLRGAALRLAQRQQKPVVMSVPDPAAAMPYRAAVSKDPVGAGSETFGSGYGVEHRADGSIWIMQH